MKKICLFLALILSACSITDSVSEFGVDNQNCIGVRKFKVLQALGHNTALAYECDDSDCSWYYNNNLDMILGDNVNEDLYDGMIYEVPTDKCAVRNGVYKYENKQGDIKTVSQVIFQYKNNPSSEEEQQYRIDKVKENLYHICMRDLEDNKQTKDEKYCICFGENYFNSNGDTQIVKKECGKFPKFLEN